MCDFYMYRIEVSGETFKYSRFQLYGVLLYWRDINRNRIEFPCLIFNTAISMLAGQALKVVRKSASHNTIDGKDSFNEIRHRLVFFCISLLV